MAILKTEGIVLKGWPFGETSKILALYTREAGKLKLIAKGARSPKSPWKGCLEPLFHLDLVYYHKPTRELQLLSQATLVDPHLGLVGDVRKSALGLAAVELVYRAVSGEEPLPALFDLLAKTLSAIDRESGFLEGLFWYFESHFISLMGYKPTWEGCVRCGGSLGIDGGFFQPTSGGLLCRTCGARSGGFDIPGETLEILYWLDSAPIEEVGRLDPSPRQKAEIRKMFDFYFKTHIEHLGGLKALPFFYVFSRESGSE